MFANSSEYGKVRENWKNYIDEIFEELDSNHWTFWQLHYLDR